jgi:hypothetical protein
MRSGSQRRSHDHVCTLGDPISGQARCAGMEQAMTPYEALVFLARGCCFEQRMKENPCATCTKTREAIETLKGETAAPLLREIERLSDYAFQLLGIIDWAQDDDADVLKRYADEIEACIRNGTQSAVLREKYAAKLAIAEKQRDQLLHAIDDCVGLEEEVEDLQELSSSISIENHRAAKAEKAAQAAMKLGLEMAAEAIGNRVEP